MGRDREAAAARFPSDGRSWTCVTLLTIGLWPGSVLAQEREVATLELPEPVRLELADAGPVDFSVDSMPPVDVRRDELAPGAGARFYDGHLVPRLSRYLDRIAPMHLESDVGANVHLTQNVLHDEFTALAERRATRGVSRAVRGYLLETPLLDGLNRRLQIRADRVRDAASTGGQGSRWSLSADVSHGRPELGLEFERGQKQLTFRVDAFGTAAIEVRHLERERLRLVAEYDAREDVYDVFCRFRF